MTASADGDLARRELEITQKTARPRLKASIVGPSDGTQGEGPSQARPPDPADLADQLQQLHRTAAALHAMVRNHGEGPVAEVRPQLAPARAARAAAFPADWPDDPHWPRRDPARRPLVPPAGFENRALDMTDLPAVAVVVTGLGGNDLNEAVAAVVARLRGNQDFKPVFILDTPDFGPVMRRGLVAEYIAEAAAGDIDAFEFGIPERRRELLTRKWNIARWIDMRDFRAPDSGNRFEKAAQPAAPPPAQKRRPRAAVVCWDLGHNPAGRAMVVYDLLARDYDVELLGPLWSRYGTDIWQPIRNSDRNFRTFKCDTLEEFVPAALTIAAGADYDLVVVSKPRLPGVFLGSLLKKATNCPLVFDVDDFELSFFSDAAAASIEELESAGPAALVEPYLELATRTCEGLVRDADAVVVSNVALRERYGGVIVRHARSESAFRRENFDRAAERAALGIADDEFAIVFVGTVRPHKGVYQVAEALEELGDPRFSLHIIGDIPDRSVRQKLDSYSGARIVCHPGCEFGQLPARIVAADAVVLMQDPDHPISTYQIPAKISDATALGVPVLATDVPPLRDLAAAGLVETVEPHRLAEALLRLAEAGSPGDLRKRRTRLREAFEAELGFEVNRARLDAAVHRAKQAGPGLSPDAERLIDIVVNAYADLRRARHAKESAARIPDEKTPAMPRAPMDIVMFWKQNDSGIYGRRCDMMMKYLLRSGRVGRVLQFDAPADLGTLEAATRADPGLPASIVLGNVIDDQFGLRDAPNHHYRTCLWNRGKPSATPLSVARSLEDYPAFVRQFMDQLGFRPESTLAWVCPVVFDFPAVARKIPFHGIIGDLIDDQRKFGMRPQYRERIIASYEETLPLFDLTFTNCGALVDAFGGLARDIHLVKNGTESVDEYAFQPPDALRRLEGPIAGYVGNLRDRFDWDLLRDVAQQMPDVTFPIVGGGARPEDVEKLGNTPNIVFTGVVPYQQVQACIRQFDVALVPHARTELSVTMNPLKIYNYFASGRPIVSTSVDNIDAPIRPFIRFADDPESFALAVSEAMGAKVRRDRSYDEALAGVLWPRRIEQVLNRIDAWLDRL